MSTDIVFILCGTIVILAFIAAAAWSVRDDAKAALVRAQAKATQPPPAAEGPRLRQAALAAFAWKETKKTTYKPRGREAKGASDEAIIDLYKDLGSINGTASALGVTWARVAEVVDREGLARTRGAGSLKRLSVDTKKAIQEAMLSGERKSSSVAKEFGVSVTTVRNVCREELS